MYVQNSVNLKILEKTDLEEIKQLLVNKIYTISLPVKCLYASASVFTLMTMSLSFRSKGSTKHDWTRARISQDGGLVATAHRACR